MKKSENHYFHLASHLFVGEVETSRFPLHGLGVGFWNNVIGYSDIRISDIHFRNPDCHILRAKK